MFDNPPAAPLPQNIVNHLLKLVMFLLGKDKPEPEKFILIKASKIHELFNFLSMEASKIFSHLFYSHQNFIMTILYSRKTLHKIIFHIAINSICQDTS